MPFRHIKNKKINKKEDLLKIFASLGIVKKEQKRKLGFARDFEIFEEET